MLLKNLDKKIRGEQPNSCVPAVARNLANEQGVIAKGMSYKQKLSWIIYDPGEVSLERVVQLAGANGEAILINDTEI